ncbi:hypothetical protein FB451DRAFT_1359179 [Mycena latifolia]|nr:hypothetical protein FB451DRAFT_1359179 [Mycena latifolia]
MCSSGAADRGWRPCRPGGVCRRVAHLTGVVKMGLYLVLGFSDLKSWDRRVIITCTRGRLRSERREATKGSRDSRGVWLLAWRFLEEPESRGGLALVDIGFSGSWETECYLGPMAQIQISTSGRTRSPSRGESKAAQERCELSNINARTASGSWRIGVGGEGGGASALRGDCMYLKLFKLDPVMTGIYLEREESRKGKQQKGKGVSRAAAASDRMSGSGIGPVALMVLACQGGRTVIQVACGDGIGATWIGDSASGARVVGHQRAAGDRSRRLRDSTWASGDIGASGRTQALRLVYYRVQGDNSELENLTARRDGVVVVLVCYSSVKLTDRRIFGDSASGVLRHQPTLSGGRPYASKFRVIQARGRLTGDELRCSRLGLGLAGVGVRAALGEITRLRRSNQGCGKDEESESDLKPGEVNKTRNRVEEDGLGQMIVRSSRWGASIGFHAFGDARGVVGPVARAQRETVT